MPRRFAVPLLTLALAAIAHAHDPYESWTAVALRPNALEINLTMAQSTALRLVDPEAKIRGLTEENFPAYRARFEQEAATLYILTAGRVPLKPRKIVVEFTDENDIAFKMIYPRPPPGRLHFHAGFLRKLGDGYACILEADDDEGHQLGWEQLTYVNPNFEIVVPVPAATAGAKKEKK